MPRKQYSKKLSHLDVLRLFDEGRYSLDPDTGIIYSRKGKELYTYVGDKTDVNDKRKWVRLYAAPGHRAMAVANVVWIVMTRCEIPAGCEIHHDNENEEDNRFSNLFCIHGKDHNRLHAMRRRLLGAAVEDDTPF